MTLAPLAPDTASVPSRRAAAVLVTGAGGPAGIAVVRRLVARGHRVVAVDADPAAAGLALADTGLVVPRAGSSDFVDVLLAGCTLHGVDALIGTVAEELPTLAEAADRLAAVGVATWLPDPAAVEVCCDKAAFAARMHAAGVPHPACADEVQAVSRVPGPWIVKPRAGRGSRGVRSLDDRAAVVTALREDPAVIAQTRLSGREFTADTLVARDGRVLAVVPRWRDETKAGISVKGTTFDSAAVARVVAEALAAVGLTGPANVQGFVAGNGAVTVVEINPRFSGGLPLTLAAGADVVSTYLAGIRDASAAPAPLTFRAGVRMSRYFAETYSSEDGAPVADPCAGEAVPR